MAAVVPALLNNLVLQLRGTEQGRSDETKFFTTHIHIISRSFSDSQYPENTTHANFQLNNLVLWSVVFFLSGYKPVLLVNLPGGKKTLHCSLHQTSLCTCRFMRWVSKAPVWNISCVMRLTFTSVISSNRFANCCEKFNAIT